MKDSFVASASVRPELNSVEASGGLEAVREAFEAWVTATPHPRCDLSRGTGGVFGTGYTDVRTALAWNAWKTAALAAPVATGEAVARDEGAAQIVFEAMLWATQQPRTLIPTKWVEGGNSLVQFAARGAVSRIMSMTAAMDEPVAWMSPAAMSYFCEDKETAASVWNRPFEGGIPLYSYPVTTAASSSNQPAHDPAPEPTSTPQWQRDNDRIRQLMRDVGMENSQSLYQAFKQIVMETRIAGDKARPAPAPSETGASAGVKEGLEAAAAICEARADYFDRAPGYRDWKDAARSYRATANEIRDRAALEGRSDG